MDPLFLNADDALLIVDVQKDFLPGGSLAIETGEEVVGVLNRWIQAARECGAKIIASRDWHPPGHTSFKQQGGPWPVHCLQDTEGAEFHPDLQLPDDAEVVSKGMRPDRDNYSPFDNTGLADELRRQGVQRVFIGGLAQDVCVRQTALDARRAGFEVHLIEDATRPVDPKKGECAVDEMREAGVFVERTRQAGG